MKERVLKQHYVVPGDDFAQVGEASGQVKNTLKMIGFASSSIRKVAIALYEGEINMAIHAGGGEIFVEIMTDKIVMKLIDSGPGIADIALAMKEGYSTASEEVRSLGFGAGMGLPNMKSNCDEFSIESTVGVGTKLVIAVYNETQD